MRSYETRILWCAPHRSPWWRRSARTSFGASSATKALRAWCEEHDLAEGEIVRGSMGRIHGRASSSPRLQLVRTSTSLCLHEGRATVGAHDDPFRAGRRASKAVPTHVPRPVLRPSCGGLHNVPAQARAARKRAQPDQASRTARPPHPGHGVGAVLGGADRHVGCRQSAHRRRKKPCHASPRSRPVLFNVLSANWTSSPRWCATVWRPRIGPPSARCICLLVKRIEVAKDRRPGGVPG